MDRRRTLLVVAAVVAALGTLLVILYVRNADQRADDKYDAVSVLVVKKQINAGETVAAAQSAGKIELGTVGKGQRLDGSLDSLAPIEGQIAQTTLYPGEQVLASKFAPTVVSGSALTIPKGEIAISVNLTDTGRVAGFVNPGDKVVIFTKIAEQTRVLLPEVEVIGVGTTAIVPTTTTDSSGAETTEQLPRTLFTLAVSQTEAEKILHATTSFDTAGPNLAFGLLTDDSKVKFPENGMATEQLFR